MTTNEGEEMKKRCTKCGEWKELSEFQKNQYRCKECRHKKQELKACSVCGNIFLPIRCDRLFCKSCQDNREKESKLRYAKKHPNHGKEYYWSHREDALRKSNEYRKQHHAEILEKYRERNKINYYKDIDKTRKKNRETARRYNLLMTDGYIRGVCKYRGYEEIDNEIINKVREDLIKKRERLLALKEIPHKIRPILLLYDSYIANRLRKDGFEKDNITTSMIELKRQQIIAKRTLRELKKWRADHESDRDDVQGKQFADEEDHYGEFQTGRDRSGAARV